PFARPSLQRAEAATEIERRILRWQRVGNKGCNRLPGHRALERAGHSPHGTSTISDRCVPLWHNKRSLRWVQPSETNVSFPAVPAGRREERGGPAIYPATV